MIGASTFNSAVSATIFAQYGRDKSKLASLAASAFRYLALTSIPLHMIATALAVPVLLLLFGHKYEGAAAVSMLAPLLCLSKAFLGPAQSLLECSERQRYVIAATVMAGVVDIGVAWSLIPAQGAVGACIGNGAAQATAVVMMWLTAAHFFKIKLPWGQTAKIALISALAATTAHIIVIRMAAARMAPLWAILCGGGASLVVLFGLFYLLRVLEAEDHDRFKQMVQLLPTQMRGPASALLSLLACPE